MQHPAIIFCGGPGATSHSWQILAALVTALLGACTDRKLGDADAGVMSTGEAAATSTTTTTGSIEPTAPTTGGAVTTGGVTSEPPPGTSTSPGTSGANCSDIGQDSECSFLNCDNECPEEQDCDGLKQLDPECPDGHKCTFDGDLTQTHCVEIVPEPKGLYEPCTSMGDWVSGLDDCGLGMLCWDVNERGQGKCIGLCDGTWEGCVCADPKAQQHWCQECATGLCLPGCDPLLQDCPGADLCIPNGDTFTCVLDASGDEGQVNDPCEFANVCDKGLTCAVPTITSIACDPQAGGCCTPFCEFPDGACPNPDQACVQWFDPDMSSEDDLDIGVCAIPQ